MAIWPNKDILSILGSPLAGDGVSIVEPRLMVRPVFVVHQPDESCEVMMSQRREDLKRESTGWLVCCSLLSTNLMN